MRAKVPSSIPPGAIWALLLAMSPLLLAGLARAQGGAPRPPLAPGKVMLIELEGVVEVQRRAGVWDPGYTNQVLLPGDQLRTADRSRAVILLSDLTTIRLAALSHIQVPDPKERTGTGFFRGILYFFHRDKPGEFEFRTPTVSAVVRGTEFSLQVADDNTTTLMLFDGEVAMTNQFGPPLYLTSGQGAVAKPNQAPQRTAMIEAANVIQWVLYYPAVLDPEELSLTADEVKALSDSLTAYRSGDLLTALSKYPAGRPTASDHEKVYYAGLLLAVGQVDQAGQLVQSPKSKVQSAESEAEKAAHLAEALRTIIDAVRYQGTVSNAAFRAAFTNKLATASELLAESYQQQAQGNLETALTLARQAREKSPKFGFAWEREAELEFSFGRTKKALAALETSLQLAPRNAQALALKGFLLSAENKISDAIAYFDQAIAIDGALANAWLGRGLCQIRQGHAAAGRTDLEVAATLEPHRAVLRSYLAKAFNNEGDNRRALKEIALAKRMDTNDPTAWLYSSLMLQQENRINESVEDLEKSEELNDNRRIYRSRLLLDQDRSVRGANLATIYQDAGMIDVSIREAARAVNLDYANYSAHLFLANSYNAFRDPHQVNLRYETPAIAEYLVANLLADVRAGTLSPAITQQEYSKLFERDRVGMASSTEYLSRGDWAQNGAVYGIYGNTSFAFEGSYLFFNGQRPNNELDQFNWSLKYKQHVTPQDSIYAQVAYGRAKYGDLAPNYFNASDPDLKVREDQDPIVIAGYHREWGPGNHTLFLAGRLHDTLRETTTNSAGLLIHEFGGQISEVPEFPLQQQYRSETEIYSVELQQIFQREQQTVIVGARYQDGEFHTEQTNAPSGYLVFPFLPWSSVISPTTPQNIRSDFQRANFYAYYHYQFADPAVPLHLIGGVSYDRIMFPVNFRFSPISTQEKTIDQVSPKLGLIWTPWKDTTIRAAWSRSLGGASIDQSFQLEPSQIAGFNQAWRSIIPEAVAGANAGAKFENWDVAWDQKFRTKTYAGVSAEYLKSKVDRVIGVFELNSPGFPPLPFAAANSGTPQTLDYNEKSLAVTLNQLLFDGWSLGARYRISEVELREQFPELLAVPVGVLPANFSPSQDLHATLHQANLFAIYNHPSGFFGQFESLWYAQNNRGYARNIPGDDFWQFNVFAGYRLPGRWAEITVGVLNLSDQDYHLNPLNLTPELPRNRTFYTALRFAF